MPIKINNNKVLTKHSKDTSITANKNEQTETSKIFAKTLKIKVTKQLDENLSQLINKVKKEGEAFIDSPDEVNLKKYKESVKKFLKTITGKFLSLKEEMGADMHGSRKVFQLVEKTENDVESLTKENLTETKAIRLLNSLDDIRGLVIDILG